MKKLGLFFVLLFYLIFTFLFPNLFKITLIDTCILFVMVIMPSILPMYLLGNLLISTSGFFKLIYALLKKFLPLENEQACTIYILSMLMGNPTTSILINQNIQNKTITIEQGKKLMSITFFMNPLFIINILPVNFSIPIIIGSLLASILIGITIKKSPVYISNNIIKDSFWKTLDKAPNILLNILMIMILISFLKIPFLLINKSLYITYLIDCLDISTGLINVAKYQISNLFLIILTTILINSNGLCLFLQTIRYTSFIKTIELIKKRLISTLISLLTTLLIYFLFYR